MRFQEIFGRSRRGVKSKKLRLSYQGEPVAFRVQPKGKKFGPRSVLYFVGEGESANPYGHEGVYELAVAKGGQTMEVVSGSPSGQAVSHYWKTLELEENHYFQGRLTTAPDIWLWDFLLAPVTKSYPFEIHDLAPVAESARLKVWLQGTTDLPFVPHHHVRVYLNGMLLEDFTLEGELPWMTETELLPGALVEGENRLELENVGDTGALYSRIMLSRFEVSYPRQWIAESGQLHGVVEHSGTAEVSGLDGGAFIVDTTENRTRWLKGSESSDTGVRFRAEDGHRYLVVDSQAVLSPEVRQPLPIRLHRIRAGAKYVVVGPETLLEAAWPLLELRASQGLSSLAVSMEQIYSEFGHGETRPQALRDFLSHAYHHWENRPRYVLLLGDGTFDFKDYIGYGIVNQVPPYPLKTTYLWTASDTYGRPPTPLMLRSMERTGYPISPLDVCRQPISRKPTPWCRRYSSTRRMA